MLAQLIEQISEACRSANLEDYEICMSDNASLDNTESMVRSLQEYWPQIVYRRNSENLGPQENIVRAVALCRGDYVWLVGDDDGVFDHSVAAILEEIHRFPSIDMFLVNRSICDVQLRPVRNDSYLSSGISRTVVLTEGEAIIDYIRDCRTVDGLGCYISSWVARRNAFGRILAEADSFFGRSLFPHVYALWKSSLRSEAITLRYVQQPLVKWRADNSLAVRGLLGRAMYLDKGFRKTGMSPKLYSELNQVIRRHYGNSLSATQMRQHKVKFDEAIYGFTHFRDIPAFVSWLYAAYVSLPIDLQWLRKVLRGLKRLAGC